MEIPTLIRQQKRKLERDAKKKNKVLQMTAAQVQQLKQSVTEETAFKALILMLGIPLMVLRDKYDFGKVRLTRFIKQCINLYDSFDKDYITLDDMHKAILDETGINVTEMGNKFYFDDTGDKE